MTEIRGGGWNWSVIGVLAGLAVIGGGTVYFLADAKGADDPPARTSFQAEPEPQRKLTYALPGPDRPQQPEKPVRQHTPRRPAKPPEKSLRDKIMEETVRAGVGGQSIEVAEAMADDGYVDPMDLGCSLPPSTPIRVRVTYAGITERGGTLMGTLDQPAVNRGQRCTVLPAGTEVSLEYWGDPNSGAVEAGHPTFVLPDGFTAQLQPVGNVSSTATNTQLPDHQSGLVRTPTFSLDPETMVTVHLRGVVYRGKHG